MSRSLPIYGGADAGPRPEMREQVRNVLEAGVDPVTVAARVAANVDTLVAEWLAMDVPGEAKPAKKAAPARATRGESATRKPTRR